MAEVIELIAIVQMRKLQRKALMAKIRSNAL
jgi:hypothetical protein